MKNTNETGNFDMMNDAECVNTIGGIVSARLDAKIKEIMLVAGLSELEVLSRLRGVPAGV